MTNKDSEEHREFQVTFVTSDTVCSEDMNDGGESRKISVAPSEVALFGVQRPLSGGGLYRFAVDVEDEIGVTHRFEVYLRNGEWTCGDRTEHDQPAVRGSHGDDEG